MTLNYQHRLTVLYVKLKLYVYFPFNFSDGEFMSGGGRCLECPLTLNCYNFQGVEAMKLSESQSIRATGPYRAFSFIC